MATPPLSVSALLKKTEHYDKDERYMATTDLCEYLKKQEAMDPKTEREICQALLTLLHDQSRDVQAVAVKTLSVLLKTVQQEQVLEIADSLTDQVLDANQEELRDVYTIGLKTLVKTMVTTTVSNRLLGPGRLLEGIRGGNEEIALACLDILCDLLTCGTVTTQHEAVLDLCLTKLSATSSIVRKRAGNALACLSTLLTDSLLQRMVDAILQDSTANPHTIIRTLCAVAGTVGHRLGQAQMDRILPLFLKFTNPEDAVNGDDEDLDEEDATPKELRESCFMGFEAFVMRCPVEVESHLQKIVTSALAFTAYDPNYAYGPEDETEDEQMEDDDEDEEMEDDAYEDEDDEDEDDESWKVRRSAIRVLKAVIEAKKNVPLELWTHSFSVRGTNSTVSKMLVGRFKEREENCRVGVIECFTRLLDVTISTNVEVADFATIYTSVLVKSSMKILSTKKGNERSKSKVLALLSTLCISPGGLGEESSLLEIFNHVESMLADKGNTEGSIKALRLEALSLVRAILSSSSHSPSAIRPSFQKVLFSQLCQSVEEQWYRAQAEALRAIALVPLLFAPEYMDEVKAEGTDPKAVATAVYSAVEPRLAAHDVDQEIKECALKAAAALLKMNQLTSEQAQRILSLLLERLQNETTRLAAVKTLASVAGCDLSSILAEAVRVLASFLQLSSRAIQQSSLETLDTLISSQGSFIADKNLPSLVLKELASRITDRDLHLCYLALRATVSTIVSCKTVGPSVKEHTLTPALSLIVSPLLQDTAIDSLLKLFEQMVVCGAVEFPELLNVLYQQLTKEVPKKGVYNLAKAIAAITAQAPTANKEGVLSDLFKLLEGFPDSGEERQVELALLITGDLGRFVDLHAEGVGEQLKNIYVGFFDSPSDDLKNAASYALGNAAVGSPSAFLEAMVSKLGDENNKQQYLLLSALREFIQSSAQSGVDISSYLGVIIPHLESHCSDAEEGVRTMVADCFGSLVCVQPDLMFPKLVELQRSHSMIRTENGLISDDDSASRVNANVCATVATAIKLSIYGKVDQQKLAAHMATFVELLQEEEISVRSSSLLMIYSAVHHMPQTITELLRTRVMPQLYTIAGLKLERKVDLGPFTHTVDDALPLRKSTLSIFASCLEDLPGCLNVATFMPLLAKFLGDAEDVQLHAHQVVSSMATKQPSFIVSHLDSFVEPLQKTLNKKAGQKTGTELERLNDWIKSALRVVLTLKKIDGAMSSRKFAEFVERVQGESKFAPHLSALASEN